jgi:ribosomal protein S18 acetylase RimI-like enzyme
MIRRAVTTDSSAIAATHIASWQTTYPGQIPEEYLRDMSIARRAAAWEFSFSMSGHSVFVAPTQCDQQVKGFVSVGPSRDEDAIANESGAIYALYLREEFKNQGLGRALWDQGVMTLAESGFTTVTMWVMASNDRARSFCERIGAKLDGGAKNIEIGGSEVLEVRYQLSIFAS